MQRRIKKSNPNTDSYIGMKIIKNKKHKEKCEKKIKPMNIKKD